MGQQAVAIPEKIFFKIGEVCDIVDVQAHVLRYWETEFPMLSPQKNRSGQRTYRRRDVEIALQIKDLLYQDLYTIAGAKKRLQNETKESGKLKIVRNESKEEVDYIKPVADIGSIEDVEVEDLEMKSAASSSGAVSDNFELDDEKQHALKFLASQLLELREILKSSQTTVAEKHIGKY